MVRAPGRAAGACHRIRIHTSQIVSYKLTRTSTGTYEMRIYRLLSTTRTSTVCFARTLYEYE
eukprot:scaffold499753_cov20-Prasinocladus_malaysianus.AAC.1